MLIRQATVVGAATADLVLEGSAGSGAVVAIAPERVAFLDYELARIVVLDTAGRTIATLGRHGGGPGEIQNPRFLVRTRSGLGVYDDAKLALVRFALDGAPQPDLPLQNFAGVPAGILTGLAQLANGQWLFSTREKSSSGYREALYLRAEGESRLLAATPLAPTRPVRLPCGIELSAEAPIFWPTLRWSAAGARVAYATTAEDRVVVWDAGQGDSAIYVGDARPPKATESAAMALRIGLTVELGRHGCALSREDALQQRGMTDEIPAIRRVALSPAGALWTELSTSSHDSAMVRIRSAASVDVVRGSPFPLVFLSDTLFVAEETDSGGNLLAGTLVVRPRDGRPSRR